MTDRFDRIRQLRWLTLVIASLLIAVGMTDASESWPSFQNGGVSSQVRSLPVQWDFPSGIEWQQAIPGYGQSSPVIWNGQVYVTSVSGAMKETYHVTAYSLKDGTKLWQYDLKNASPQESSGYVSKAAPTPAADERGVVCFFEGGNLLALSHAGKVRWERNLVEEFGAIDGRHGISASVEQNAEAAFIWVERSTEPYVTAVDKETGKSLWKVPGVGKTSWASPRLVPVGDKSHLVLSAVGVLVGLDPQSGERLWSMDRIAGNSTPTPIPAGEGRFLIGATTGQGPSEGSKAHESNGMIAIVRDANGTWKADWVWHAARATSSFGSPILSQGNAYFVNRTGVLYCLDEKTGEERYAQRAGESIWATPLAAKDHLLLFGKGGAVTAIATGAKFEKLAESRAWESTGAAPAEAAGPPGGSSPVLYGAAFADGRLILRRGDQLICIPGDR